MFLYFEDRDRKRAKTYYVCICFIVFQNESLPFVWNKIFLKTTSCDFQSWLNKLERITYKKT